RVRFGSPAAYAESSSWPSRRGGMHAQRQQRRACAERGAIATWITGGRRPGQADLRSRRNSTVLAGTCAAAEMPHQKARRERDVDGREGEPDPRLREGKLRREEHQQRDRFP